MTTTDSEEQAPRRRETRQRSAVSSALEGLPEFVSAQDLHLRLRERGERVGLATVYRTLQQLASDGQIDVLRTADGESTYRACSSGHHHHLTCRTCRRSIEIDAAAIETWARTVAAAHDYTDVDHVVEVFGTCANCR